MFYKFYVCDGTFQFKSFNELSPELYLYWLMNEPLSCHGRLGQFSGHIVRRIFSLPPEHLAWEGPSPSMCAACATCGPRAGHGQATGEPRLPAAWKAPGQKINSLGGQAWPGKRVGAAQAWPLWKGCRWATHGPRLCVAHPHPYFLTSLSIVHGRKRVHSLLACK